MDHAMNEKQFGNLLRDPTDPASFDAVTEAVLRRDRRRIRVLAALCVVAWMAVVMLPWATTLPMLAKVVIHQDALYGVPATGAQSDAGKGTTEVLQIVKQAVILTFVNSLIAMFVAASFTVALIVVSRRATLRQVNARLAEISAHLQALTQGAKNT
jgi:hypothetical protein